MKSLSLLLLLILLGNVAAEEKKADVKLKPGAKLDYDFSFLPDKVAEYKKTPLTSKELVAFIKPRLKVMETPLVNQKQLKLLCVDLIQEYYDHKVALELALEAGYEPNIGLASLELEIKEKEMGRQELEKQFALTGRPYENATQFLAEINAIEEWHQDKIIGDNQVSESEALVLFMQNKEKFKVPQKVRFAQIYIGYITPEERLQAKEKMFLAQLQVKQGKSFAEVAKQFSEGKNAANGGLLNVALSEEELRPELKPITSMKEGEVSSIIESADGFHLIHLIKKEDPYLPKFKSIKGPLMERLSREKAINAVRQLIIKQKIAGSFRIYIE